MKLFPEFSIFYEIVTKEDYIAKLFLSLDLYSLSYSFFQTKLKCYLPRKSSLNS